MKIKDLPLDQQPREKALCYGIEAMGDGELLALLIGSGTKGKSALEIGNELISTYQNLKLLSRENYAGLSRQKGLSTVISLKLCACFEIARRMNSQNGVFLKKVSSSSELYSLYRDIGLETAEKAYLIMMDKKGRILKERKIDGNYSSSVEISAKEIINDVLLCGADMLAVIHNHPNGGNEPSDEDIIATDSIEEVLRSIGATLFDHLIVTGEGYYSFRDGGLLREYHRFRARL